MSGNAPLGKHSGARMCRCPENLNSLTSAALSLFEPLLDLICDMGIRREARRLAKRYAEINRRFPPPAATAAEVAALQQAQRAALLDGEHCSHTVPVGDGSGHFAYAVLERGAPEVWVCGIFRPDRSQVNGRGMVKEWLGYVPEARPETLYRGELRAVVRRGVAR
jgi:hypothetical protein